MYLGDIRNIGTTMIGEIKEIIKNVHRYKDLHRENKGRKRRDDSRIRVIRN